MAFVWPFLACLAVVALSDAGLVLTVPHLVTEGDPGLWGAATILAIVLTGFALLGYRLRPTLATPKR